MTTPDRAHLIERDALAERAREFLVLNAIAEAVAESLEPQPLLESALNHVLDLLELDGGCIYVRDGAQFQMVAQRGGSPALVEEFGLLTLDDPYMCQIVDEQRPLALSDLADVPELANIAILAGFHAMLGLPLARRGQVTGLLIVLRAGQGAITSSERRQLEAIADHIALALENARLYSAEQQRRRQSEALRKGALALTTALDPDDVLRGIVQQATELMETPTGAIYERTAHDAQLVIRTASGVPPAEHVRYDQLGQRAVQAAIDAEHAISLSDPSIAPTLDQIDVTLCSVLAAPLLVKGHVYGGLVVYSPARRGFSPNEIELLAIFADQAALALEHARLINQGQQLAAIEERQRIARDLHDSVTQTLFSLRLAAQAARTTLPHDPQAAAAMLDTVQELAGGALAEMRALIFELRPDALREAGLAAAIERFAGAFRSRTGVAVTLRVPDQRLPLTVEEALYRIVGEALANVAKHANATAITIELQASAAEVQLAVHDDGVGFDPQMPIVGDHMGQRTMHERATALGGTCTIRSADGCGTTVFVTIPLRESEATNGSDQRRVGG